MEDGLHIEWSNVNQAWFLMWHGSVLRILPSKAEALDAKEDILREVYGPLAGRRSPSAQA